MTHLLLTAVLLTAAVVPGRPVLVSDLAPADEYFGRAHLSALVIRHKIFALKDDLHHMRMQPGDVAHDAGIVADALSDWAAKFPRDYWLPATGWTLATLYEELPGPEAQTRAVQELTFVSRHYAGTPFGAYAARDLTRGVGIRPWPHWAAASAPPDAQRFAVEIAQLNSDLKSQHDENRAETELLQRENDFWRLSRDGADPAYARAAWELAATYERLPGPNARDHAIRMLALLVDRFPSLVYGKWALRDLERGIGVR